MVLNVNETFLGGGSAFAQLTGKQVFHPVTFCAIQFSARSPQQNVFTTTQCPSP